MLAGAVTLAAAAAPASAMVEVPAGAFTMGSGDGDADERPARRVSVAGFSIDRAEVSDAAYARCVQAGACRAPATEGPVEPDLPATGVSWHDARAYCAWAGKRLPSEAEWEKAARGRDGRRYPWGARPDCARANFGNWAGSGPCPDNPGRPERVGSRPRGASPYGALDMGGNVWEWTADAYPGEADKRVLRGGSCCGLFTFPRASERLRFPADFRDADIGFRCAADERPRRRGHDRQPVRRQPVRMGRPPGCGRTDVQRGRHRRRPAPRPAG